MKVLLTATVQSHIVQFHKPLVEVLHAHGCEVHVAARDNLAEKNGLKLNFVDKVYDVPFARSPKSTDNIKAYKQLKKIIDDGNYDIVHCNTPMGGIVTRLAARKARKNGTKVFYTAHGFHFYKGAPKKNWIVFYPIEKFFAGHYTDILITISDADFQAANMHKFKTNLYRIHSVGINTKKYYVRDKEICAQIRSKRGYSEEDFVCICTGELNSNKNQRSLIEVVPEILKNTPNFRLILAGNGPEKEKLENQIKELNIEKYVQLIGYRTDLEEFVAFADIAISVSKREGLGINLIEAMACGKPVIGSYNRGHREFIKDGKNGFIIKDESFKGKLIQCVTQLASSPTLRNAMGNQALKDASVYMDWNVIKELEEIYFVGAESKNEQNQAVHQ